jgi:uncharacterized membrane protein YdbT with pleckstrin-like domain
MDHLSEGETIIYEGHPSWRSTLTFYVKGLGIAIVIGLLAALIAGGTFTVTVAVFVVLAATVVVGFVKRMATTYSVTSKRLHIKRGLISRRVQETRLYRVQNVNTEQGPLERMLGIGSVDFDTAGTDDSDFTFTGIADPEGIAHKVDHASHEAQLEEQRPAV